MYKSLYFIDDVVGVIVYDLLDVDVVLSEEELADALDEPRQEVLDSTRVNDDHGSDNYN